MLAGAASTDQHCTSSATHLLQDCTSYMYISASTAELQQLHVHQLTTAAAVIMQLICGAACGVLLAVLYRAWPLQRISGQVQLEP